MARLKPASAVRSIKIHYSVITTIPARCTLPILLTLLLLPLVLYDNYPEWYGVLLSDNEAIIEGIQGDLGNKYTHRVNVMALRTGETSSNKLVTR